MFTLQEKNNINQKWKTKIGKMISVDVTFKTSKPIGLRRKEDKKVVHQYNNLFIVLNEQREVVQWKLCIGLRHKEIRKMIENLSMRNPHLKTVLVDNCCVERQFYEEFFFSESRVFLELFHAVQRFTRELPKKKTPLCKKSASEYGLVFRNTSDFGKENNGDTRKGSHFVKFKSFFEKTYSTF